MNWQYAAPEHNSSTLEYLISTRGYTKFKFPAFFDAAQPVEPHLGKIAEWNKEDSFVEKAKKCHSRDPHVQSEHMGPQLST